MSISKCPVCGSTNISDVACNNCGEMLLFLGDDKNGTKETGFEKKPSFSMEDIVKEILESANVKTYPFEKIEYIDNDEYSNKIKDEASQKSENAEMDEESLSEERDVSKIDANKSFVDLAIEMGYVASSDDTDEDADKVIEEPQEEFVETVDESKNEDLDMTDELEETVSDDFGNNLQSDENDANQETVESEDDVENSYVESGSEECIQEKTETTEEATEEIIEETTEEATEETTEETTEKITEETAQENTPKDDRVALVAKISQAVNERIRNESGIEEDADIVDDEDIDMLAPPQWTHSEKTVIKEKSKKKQKEVSEQTDEDLMEIDTKFNLTLNISRFLIMFLMLITVVCMFLPSTRIGGFSVGQDVQIFAIISVIPFAIGFALSVKERFYIRKFIYGLLSSVVFAAVYFAFMVSFSGSSAKDVVYPVLCGAITVVSIVGIFADRSSGIRKANTWFDAFSYILLFVNLFVILFVALAMIVVPDMLGGPDISLYLYELCAVMLVGVISAILILKRVSFGADLLLLASIALIFINIISYNKIMSAVSFDYTVNIPYMHYVGVIVSAINIVCTLFPIGMFFWLKYLKRVTPNQSL